MPASYYSPLFNHSFPLATKSPNEKAFRRLAQRSPKIAELLDTLIGATAGATAAVSEKRVAAADELGGARSVETRNIINRATTADDRAALRAMFATDSRIATPVNAAGVNWRA